MQLRITLCNQKFLGNISGKFTLKGGNDSREDLTDCFPFLFPATKNKNVMTKTPVGIPDMTDLENGNCAGLQI